MKKQIGTFILLFLIVFIMSTVVYADQIELQNGQKLRGDVQNDSLSLKTVYAELNIQSQYINKINRETIENEEDNGENEKFVFRATENNRFSGQLLSDIILLANGEERTFSASEITSIDFSANASFSDNKKVSVDLRNGDFFFGSTVEKSISINTSLGSSLNISYDNIISIEYLSGEDIYLIKLEDTSDLKSDLSGQKIIIWPAAGEIVELEFKYVKKINFK